MWLEVRFEAANPDKVGTFRRKISECEANYNRADAPVPLLTSCSVLGVDRQKKTETTFG